MLLWSKGRDIGRRCRRFELEHKNIELRAELERAAEKLQLATRAVKAAKADNTISSAWKKEPNCAKIPTMASDLTGNAETRRGWLAGVATPSDVDTMNDSFWEGATIEQRLDVLRTLAEEASMMEGYGAPARLQRHIGGIRRLSG